MILEVLYYLYLTLLALSLSIVLIRHRYIDKPTRTIWVLLLFTLLGEIVSEYYAVKYGNNMPVYHFYNPIELLIISIYFNYRVEYFKVRSLGFIIGGLGLIIGILNTLFIQGIKELNSYFLLFEGFVIIFYSLTYFIQIFQNTNTQPLFTPHFWYVSIFLFKWGITYANWSLYSFIGENMIKLIPSLAWLILLVNIISFGGFAIVFYYLPKMLRDEQ